MKPEKLAKLAKTLVEVEKGSVGVAGLVLELDKKIEDTDQKLSLEVVAIREIAENTAKQKGDKGDNYVLTDTDRSDIASKVQVKIPTAEAIAKKVKVPVVEKVIEKRTEVIKEQPIHYETVKEVTNNVENKDTGEQIVTKINSQDTLIKAEKVEGLKLISKDIKDLKERPAQTIIQGVGGGASGIREIRAGSNVTVTNINDIVTVSATVPADTDTLDAVTDRGNTTTNDISVGKITTPRIQFDTAATPATNAEGLLQWNATDGTLDLGMSGGDIRMQLGQEMFMKVRNVSGSTIPNGSPVYVSGRTGNRPNIYLAKSDADSTSGVIGLTTQDIDSPADGFVTTFGYVRQIKTDYSGAGNWGTTWVEGDKLYISKTVAGQLTNVEPDAPHHSDVVATVELVGGAGIGELLVNLNQHKTLDELSDVDGGAPDATGDLLSWNNTSSTWERNAYNITDYLTTSTASTTYAKLDGSNHPFTYVKTPNIRPNSDSTTAIQITKADGTTPIMNFDTTNSRIAVNRTPSTGTFAIKQNSDDIAGGLILFDSADAYGSGIYREAGNFGALVFRSQSIDTMFVKSGYVGIGTTTPDGLLTVRGVNDGGDVFARIVNSTTTAGSTASLKFTVTTAETYDVAELIATRVPNGLKVQVDNGDRLSIYATGITATAPYYSPDGAVSAPAYSFTSDANTGMYSGGADSLAFATAGVLRATINSVGTLAMSPTTDIEPITLSKITGGSYILGLQRFSNDSNAANIFFRKSRGALNAFSATQTSDRLGGFVFQGSGTSAWVNGAAFFADADGVFTNSSAPTRLVFLTTPSGSTAVAERMRITSDGNVGIGTTTPLVRLHLHDTANNPNVEFSGVTVPDYTGVGFWPNVNTSTNGRIGRASTPNGGLTLFGFNANTDVVSGVTIGGYLAKTSGNTKPAITFYAFKHNGTTGRQDIAATEKIAAFSNGATEKVVVLGDGSIGIGTTTPSEILHIKKDVNAGALLLFENPNAGTSAFAGLRFDSDGGQSYIYRTSTTYTSAPADSLIIQDSGGGDIHLRTSGNNRVSVSSSGNVGIGTTAPTAPATSLGSSLHIYTNNDNDYYPLILENASTGTSARAKLLFKVGGNEIASFDTNPTSINWVSRLNNTGTIGFYTLTSAVYNARLFIANAGNVGIGTTAPVVRLHTSGTGPNIIISETTDNTTNSVATLQAYSLSTNLVSIAHAAARTITRYGITLGGWAEIITNNGTSGSTNGLIIGTGTATPIVFGTNDVERVRILSDGKVGVATTSPNSTLHSNGSVAYAYVAKTANYTATASDYTIDCTANSFTITLPTAVGITGRIYQINNSGTGTITVDADGTETINGDLTQTLAQWEQITVQSNGANWILIH